MPIVYRLVAIALLFFAIFAAMVVFFEKLIEDKKRGRTRAIFYRTVPDHNGWTRTEILATVGLLVAILGMIISLLRV
jgi:hypothetical protein